jgi:hypothetical protein
VSKRLERENARDIIEGFTDYDAPRRRSDVARYIDAHEFEAAAACLREFANRCDKMKEYAAKLNGGDNG